MSRRTEITRLQEIEHRHSVLLERQESLQRRVRYMEELTGQQTSLIEWYKWKVERLEETIEELKTIPAVVTSYAPLDPNAVRGMCYSGDPSVTATGSTVRRGVAAADFNLLPPGTRFTVSGRNEVFTVEDTGGALRDTGEVRVDIFSATREEAFAWGVRELDITIMLEGD